MTIIHVSSASSWRGGEQQIAYLLLELAKQNMLQMVFCPKGSPLHTFCEKNNIDVNAYRKRSGIDLWTAYQITKFCRRADSPIIHTHDSKSHTAAFLAAALFMNKVPVVVHRRVSFPIKKSILSDIKYNYNVISRIICVSEFARAMVTSRLIKTDKTVTIHDGIDISRFTDKKAGHFLRKKYAFQKNNILIGNISALTAEKDFFTFVDTADYLLTHHPDFRFLIIGDGPQEQEIALYIKEKGIEEKVIMTGFLDNIPDILPELDLFLFTSASEGLGTTLLDAFACKIPVVSTNAGGIPEIVKHNFTGLLAGVKQPLELADAVEKILSDYQLKSRLVENAFAAVHNFSAEIMALKTIEVYKNALIENTIKQVKVS
jgi:glycosyltransferase involved in cell wall biosynthesis